MKNECQGSGFYVGASRSFLEPGERTECSWCHRMVPVTRTLQLRTHSLALAPAPDGLRRSISSPGPRRSGGRPW
jgi:phage portal protein BeeE